ncbi:MAG TPA: M13 family peptidase [Hellea balneolensis]|uniref:M13 family peptidase n=1 Tax=Hellea balneolensis TaxID=287478 RepID=A0A7C5QW80_9PROT|nr:M13 family peptidase [Hellea balneolensis]
MTIKRIIVPSVLAISVAMGVGACKDKPASGETGHKSQATTTKTSQNTPELGSFGVALDLMDQSVKPGDDFFKYVNGKWLEKTEIPADKSNYGSFTKLADRSEKQVQKIIQDMAKSKAAPGSNEQKIGDLYAAFMDTDTIEKKGLDPIKADLDYIRSLKDHDAIAAAMGDPAYGLQSPIGGWVWTDAKNPEEYVFYITQSGLGMPNRSYYLDDDDKTKKTRAAYLVFLNKMLGFSGVEDTKARAQAVMDFETEMAKKHWKPEKRRNRDLTYNKMTMKELVDYAPGFDWQSMAKIAGIADQDHFILREKDALKGLAEVFAKTPVNVLQDYMTIHHISGNSAYLPKDIDDASFAFYGTAVRGTEQQRDRWKRAVSFVSGNLGEAIGQVYVQRHFKPSAKAQMDELVENLRSAFKDGIDGLEWMGEETKAQAQDKLAKFYPKIGYPKKWKDYSTMTVDRNDLIGSAKSTNVWQWQDMIGKLGKPIDKEEWGMTPQTVNAYYNPGYNEIVFPAAILQAPFFDPNADPAVNYGGIGAVIGHEMGHGFDDQGAKSDGDGKQRNWWTPEDEAAFKDRTKVLVEQYSAYEPLPGHHINGELTLGENIGDLTGITMAYAAYKKSLGGKEAPVIDGYTGDQRFFLSYGQIWQRKFREDALINRLKTDPHSPGPYRANGIVRNFDAWYDAFDVKPGDKLYLAPEKRVKIW